jgi:hypothetical protein
VNRNVRSFLLLGCVIAVGMVAVASASAGGKGPFKPKTGSYSGSFATSSGTVKTTGTVEKTGKKYLVQPEVGGTAKCQDGSILAGVPMGLQAAVKGRSFSATEEVTAPGGKFIVKLKGRFTSEKAFTGTVSAESAPQPGVAMPEICSVEPISFTLQHG